MAKTDNITKYTCDRCAKGDYLVADDPRKSDWREIKRVTADGVTASRLLCADCNKSYKSLVATQDAAFNSFMAEVG